MLSAHRALQAGRYVVTSPVGGMPTSTKAAPGIGELVPPDDPAMIADAFDRAITQISRDAIDPAAIRGSLRTGVPGAGGASPMARRT